MRDLTKTFHQSPKIQSIHKGTENHIDKLMQPENTNKIKSTNHKKNPSAYFIRNVRKNRSPKSNKRKSTLERVFDIVPEGKSPLQLKEERVKKEKQMKKMLLLSQFDVDDDSKKEMLENSPTTEAMKNSIIAIKGETKINAMKEIYQNNIVVNGNSNTIKGKKPCARDGCTGNLFNGKLVIFGGDRHLMAFHDLYFLNIKHLI